MIGFKPIPPSLSRVRRFAIALLCFASFGGTNIQLYFNKVTTLKYNDSVKFEVVQSWLSR